MRKRKVSTFIGLLLAGVTFVNAAACAPIEIKATNLMAGITPRSVTVTEELNLKNSNVIDFSVRLFQASKKSGENTLVSPLSVLYALAMVANGAKGQTLEQIEQAIGMPISDLNLYLYGYMKNLPQGEKYKLNLANSIWLKEDELFTVNQNFLQTNADYYGADVYKAPFDNQTLADINNWVKLNTNGMIPKILNKIPEDVIFYLVNALAFEAEWARIYLAGQVEKGEFTMADGTKQTAEFMCEKQRGSYIEDENAIGFVKYYSDDKYAFVAMLPNEGVSLSEYVASLTASSLNELLSNPKYAQVETSLPKFEVEYGVEMSNILGGMGISAAFDYYSVDFSGLGSFGDKKIAISGVLHKTFISVGEKGTKAGAVTVIGGGAGAAPPTEIVEIYLDRPFVYMLIDCENNIPFFMGTLENVGR